MNGVALYDKVLEKSSILELGKMLAQSGMFGVRSEAQGGVVAMTCYTENISLTQFKQKYHFIEQGNTLSMRTDFILSEFYKREGKVKFVSNTDEVVEMIFTNKNFPDGYTVKHTLKEFMDKKVATSSKTGKLKDNWAKHPANMLRARCVSDAIRVVDPEIIAGFYPQEVVQDFSEDQQAISQPTPFTEATVVGEKEQETFVQTVVEEATDNKELIVRMRDLLDVHNAHQAFTQWLIANDQIMQGQTWQNLQNTEILQRAVDNPVKFIEAITANQGGAA